MSAPRPDGPAAALSPLTGGAGVSLLVAGPSHDLAAAGYVEAELAASGTATSYRPVGELGPDGDWTVEPDASAEYVTRIVVRRPADASAFNGTVVVEWFNVTAGTDTAADLAAVGEELRRGGYAYVGVSAQALGIEGGDPALPVGPLGAAVRLRASASPPASCWRTTGPRCWRRPTPSPSRRHRDAPTTWPLQVPFSVAFRRWSRPPAAHSRRLPIRSKPTMPTHRIDRAPCSRAPALGLAAGVTASPVPSPDTQAHQPRRMPERARPPA